MRCGVGLPEEKKDPVSGLSIIRGQGYWAYIRARCLRNPLFYNNALGCRFK